MLRNASSTEGRPAGTGSRATSAVDPELIARASQGDAEALDELCRLTWKPVYRLMVRGCGSRGEAEDLTQSVFLRVLTALPGSEERGVPFEAYLYRVARHVLIDRWRAVPGGAMPLESMDDQVSSDPGPEHLADLGEQRRDLLLAFAQLSADHQQILRLRLLEGKTSPEVATLLGSTAPAVRQMQVRAVAALRDAVGRVADSTVRKDAQT